MKHKNKRNKQQIERNKAVNLTENLLKAILTELQHSIHRRKCKCPMTKAT